MDDNMDEKQPVLKPKRKQRCMFTFKEIMFVIGVLVLEMGIEYGYDTPGSLQVTMMKYYDLTYYQYSLFYSLYSLPNIFHSFIGGFLIDRLFGIKVGALIYTSVAMIGMIIFASGAQLKTFWLMLLGRLVYGIGAEMSGTVCLNYFIFTWFKDSYVNLVYSLADNIGYVGTLLTYSTSQNIYDYLSIRYKNVGALDITLTITSAFFVIPVAGGFTMALLKPPKRETNEDSEITNEKVRFSDCLTFPLKFWLLCFLYGCYSNGVYTIQDFQQDFLVKEFSKTVDEANTIVNILTAVQVLTSIPFSLIVDRLGRNAQAATLSIVAALLAHVFVCLQVSPYISLGLLGISYSLMGSSVWPMFAYSLEDNYHGLGYGIASCFQSLSLTVCPMAAGQIIDANGYFAAEYFYFGSLTISLLCMLAVNVLDRKSTGVLSMTTEQRNDYLNRKESR